MQQGRHETQDPASTKMPRQPPPMTKVILGECDIAAVLAMVAITIKKEMSGQNKLQLHVAKTTTTNQRMRRRPSIIIAMQQMF